MCGRKEKQILFPCLFLCKDYTFWPNRCEPAARKQTLHPGSDNLESEINGRDKRRECHDELFTAKEFWTTRNIYGQPSWQLNFSGDHIKTNLILKKGSYALLEVTDGIKVLWIHKWIVMGGS